MKGRNVVTVTGTVPVGCVAYSSCPELSARATNKSVDAVEGRAKCQQITTNNAAISPGRIEATCRELSLFMLQTSHSYNGVQ